MSKMTKTVATLGVVAGLGVAMLPLGAYAVNTPGPVEDGPKAGPVSINVDFQAEVKESISISSADSLVDGGEVTPATIAGGTTKITIKTNNASGYKATIAANTGEVKGESGDVTTAGTANMVSGSHTIAGGTVAKGTSAWGYQIGSLGTAGTDGEYDQGWTFEPAAIATEEAPAKQFTNDANTGVATDKDGDKYDLYFGVSVDAAQPAGTYTGRVVLTATANPAS